MRLVWFAPSAIVLCIATGLCEAQQIQVNKDNRTVAITTTATAKAAADSAVVHIGFLAYAPDAESAYAKASKVSNEITAALLKRGVPKDAIESEAQSVGESEPFQMQNLTPEERAQRRYRVQQSWTVKAGAKEAPELLNLAVNGGANNSGQIDWSVSDEDALQAEAAAKALQRAKTIAEQMAKGLGAQLGPLVFSSNEAPSPVVYSQMGVAKSFDRMQSFAPPPPPPLSISPQQVIRSATVYAVFALQ